MTPDQLIQTRKLFDYYKSVGEKTFEQLEENDLFWQYNKESNSIAIIVNHLSGNMLSRWTDFLTSDGEKEWRNRDQEFESVIKSSKELHTRWNEGWNCLFEALDSINEVNINTTVLIRNQEHTIFDAITRQLAHYSYHIGQIVYIGRMIKSNQWQSLTIPKGKSEEYNKAKFSKGQHGGHFSDGIK
ncbi:DUF1572 family protein [Marinigracilibium pacificum]|uniref:DUF1572 family protein n=1 Tax=Marinigracilibium pacificum TaxID=2729599 RepID=A0A848IWL9_9BACT|nr:DUF1572 family protein [Marinigracilibium pacificum]NMM47671.1 DUF1572 family protein [Marinigracilibium pacificum]